MVLGDAPDLRADVYIGPEHALSRERYFIVVVNQIGNGLSTSPHNTDSPFAVARFPHVRIGDDVRAREEQLREEFGIEQLELVPGGSMGAQQTYEWAVRFPDKVKRGPDSRDGEEHPARLHLHRSPRRGHHLRPRAPRRLVRSLLGRARRSFPARADLVGRGVSTEFWKQEQWRNLGFASADDFQVGFVDAYVQPMDPNDLLCMARKWQWGDVSKHTGGDLVAALDRIKAKTFVMPIDEDMFSPCATAPRSGSSFPAANCASSSA